MTLQWQNVPINLVGGIDTKTDEYALRGKLLRARNAVFTAPGAIKKRNGYVRDAGPGAAGKGVYAYDNEALVHDNIALYGYAGGGWQNRGELRPIRVYDQEIGDPANVDAVNFQGAKGGDLAVSGQYVIYCWVSNSIAYATVYDTVAQAFVVGQTAMGGNTASIVKAVLIGTSVCVLYNETNGANVEVRMRVWSIGAPSVFGAFVLLHTQSTATYLNFDAVPFNANTFGVLAVGITGSIVRVGRFNTGGMTLAVVNSAAGPGNASMMQVIVMPGGEAITAGVGAAGAWHAVWNAAGAAVGVNTIDGFGAGSITVVQSGPANTAVVAYNSNVGIKKATITTVPGSSGVATLVPTAVANENIALGANAFVLNGDPVVPIVFFNTIRMVNITNGFCVAQAVYDRASFDQGTVGSSLSRAVMIDSTHLAIVMQKQIDIIASLGQRSYQAVAVVIDLAPRPSSVRVGGELAIAAGLLMAYDGAQVLEQGFLHQARVFQNPATAGVGGNMSNGTYAFRSVFVWHDATGQKHYSRPSDAILTTISAGTATQTITCTVGTYRMSRKTAVVIELYGTVNGGSTYFFIGRANNNPAAPTITIVRTQADASITGNQVLYTQGEVENIPPPSPLFVGISQDRAFVYVGDGLFYVSKPRLPFQGVAFADELTKQMTTVRDPIAVVEMDEKTVVLARDGLAYFIGQGADAAGNGGFTEDRLITADVGAVDASSVVRTGDGIEFETAKGKYLLGRDLSVTYIGAEVEAYNDRTVTGAVLASTRNQVKFMLGGAAEDVLVYDYFVRQWATETNTRDIVHAAVINGEVALLDATSALHRQREGVWADNATPVGLFIRLGWVTPAELQGFVRARRILMLARKLSDCRLTLKVHYDYKYDGPLTETFTFDAGAGGLAIPNGEVMQVRTDKLANMKCEAFAIDVIEDTAAYAAGAGFAIQQFMVEVGVKKGARKLGGDRQFTRS